VQEIAADELVVGDLVFVRSGARVPADVRLLQCNGLRLETSSITGEAEPLEFTHEAAVGSSTTVFESRNVAFNGSFCVDGEGLGVVVRVADNTVSLFYCELAGANDYRHRFAVNVWALLSKRPRVRPPSMCITVFVLRRSMSPS
jgi:hypothetical protein